MQSCMILMQCNFGTEFLVCFPYARYISHVSDALPDGTIAVATNQVRNDLGVLRWKDRSKLFVCLGNVPLTMVCFWQMA